MQRMEKYRDKENGKRIKHQSRFPLGPWKLETIGSTCGGVQLSLGTHVFPVDYVGGEPVFGRCLMLSVFTVVASFLFIAGSFAAHV